MLSPRKIPKNTLHSKQNASPTRVNSKEDKLSKEVLISTVQELQTLLIRSGIQIPQHLNLGLLTKLQLVKVDSLIQKSSNSELRNLKIKLNDYEFELKKIQEDYAEYKILTKIQREKQVKKLKTQISRLEKLHQQDNEKWENKFEEIKMIYQQKYTQLKSQTKQENQLYLQTLIVQKHQQTVQLQQKYKNSINQLKIQSQKTLNELIKQNKVKIQIQQTKVEQEKQTARKKHVQIVRKLEHKQEQNVLALQSQKKVQEKKHQEEKINFCKVKEKLYTDLYLVRKQKDEIQKINKNLKIEICHIKKNFGIKELQVQQEKQIYDKKLANNKQEYLLKLKQAQWGYDKQNQTIYKKQIQNLNKLEEKIKFMEICQKDKESVFKVCQQQVQRKFEERPSKAQDMQKISKQKYELMVKQEQVTNLQQQIKQCKLEKDNNQKNYNRIFSASGSRQKMRSGTIQKESQRERIYKQANTVDLNSLLKVCQKHF